MLRILGGNFTDEFSAASVPVARVELEPGSGPERPWIETATAWITTGSGPPLGVTATEAVEGLAHLLMDRLAVSHTDAFRLVSARDDVRIGQCARIPNLAATAYPVFPKSVDRLSTD